ncbi:hypothetical protein ACFV2X_54290, partial [Streptomyces sp. NPDC059679]|uniref:hypothetical protein n=1 Tax=Streptomyces sp. NPDC059679 TaxID=3346903 RepID=UPI00367A8811
VEQSQTHDQRSCPYFGDRKTPGQPPHGNKDTFTTAKPQVNHHTAIKTPSSRAIAEIVHPWRRRA